MRRSKPPRRAGTAKGAQGWNARGRVIASGGGGGAQGQSGIRQIDSEV